MAGQKVHKFLKTIASTLFLFGFFLLPIYVFATSNYGSNTYGSGPYNSGIGTIALDTISASNILTTSVTLNGGIISDGFASSTDQGFNWGVTSAYGNVASTTGAFGMGSFSKSITGLTCATTYHYNAFAINPAGTATTSDATFITASCPVSGGGSSVGGGTGSVSSQTAAQFFGITISPIVAPATAPAAQNFTFTRTLIAGQSGTDVKALQKYLNARGFIVSTKGPGSKGNETMFFGAATKAALIKFQRSNKISASGFFGPITKAFIQKNP